MRTAESDRAFTLRIRDRERRSLEDQAAIQRLDEGTGICEDCGEDISIPRSRPVRDQALHQLQRPVRKKGKTFGASNSTARQGSRFGGSFTGGPVSQTHEALHGSLCSPSPVRRACACAHGLPDRKIHRPAKDVTLVRSTAQAANVPVSRGPQAPFLFLSTHKNPRRQRTVSRYHAAAQMPCGSPDHRRAARLGGAPPSPTPIPNAGLRSICGKAPRCCSTPPEPEIPAARSRALGRSL